MNALYKKKKKINIELPYLFTFIPQWKKKVLFHLFFLYVIFVLIAAMQQKSQNKA